MAGIAEVIVAATTASGSISSLTGVTLAWIKARRNQSMRLSINLHDGIEISIRTDKATPREVEEFMAKIAEAEAGPGGLEKELPTS